MKKLMALSLLSLLAATNVYAVENDQAAPQQQNEITNQPFAALRIFDTSGNTPKLKEGNRLSRHQKRELCVVVGNIVPQEKNLFAQYFQAPKKMQMNLSLPNVKVEEQGRGSKNYLVTSTLSKEEIQNNSASFCWSFEPNDPLGDYKIDVQFNDIVFKDLKFTLIK